MYTDDIADNEFYTIPLQYDINHFYRTQKPIKKEFIYVKQGFKSGIKCISLKLIGDY